jgi:dTDP-4-dehydrorhamnose reductase
MTRVLLCGANGQLGREIQRTPWPPGFDVRPIAHEQLDITDERAVMDLVEQLSPALVVNAAAYTAVDRAEDEPAQAFGVNAAGAAHLVRAAERCGARVLHLSTDYVFDGSKDGWYAESDPVRPLGVYGRSKVEGERAALEYPGATVLRTAWLYGALGSKTLRRPWCRLPKPRSTAASRDNCSTSLPLSLQPGTNLPRPSSAPRERAFMESSGPSRRHSIRRAQHGPPTVGSTPY